MKVSQHILRTLLAVLFPVVLALLWLVYSGWKAQHEAVEQQLDSLALQQQQLLDAQLLQGRRVAAALAETDWARSLDDARCPVGAMQQFLLAANGFSDMVTLTASGQVVCSTTPVKGVVHMRAHYLPELKDLLARQSIAVSEPMLTPDSRRRVVLVSHPLRDTAGKLQGQVVLALDLQHLVRPATPAWL